MRVFAIVYLSCLFMIISKESANCAKLPSTFKKCKITDSTCMKNSLTQLLPSLANGIPELGIEPLDPLSMGFIPSEGGLLKFNATDATLAGLSKSRIDEVSFDTKKKRITLGFRATTEMKNNYKANGRLLILPVVGDGKGFFKTIDMDFVYKMAYEIKKGKDGKEYFHITKHKITFKPTDVAFHFTNLFNGNKQLSDALHQFGNEHWRDLFSELASPFNKVQASKIVENMNRLFEKIPISELFLS